MRISMKKMITIAFAAGIYGLSVCGFAQTKENDDKLLHGKWVLENVSAFDENRKKLPLNADSLEVSIPLEMDIQQENIVFVWKEYTETAKYNAVVKGEALCFPICAEWKVSKNKLQLQWIQDMDIDDAEMDVTIVLTYKLRLNRDEYIY